MKKKKEGKVGKNKVEKGREEQMHGRPDTEN